MLPLVVALNVATTIAIEDRTEVRARIVTSPRVDTGTATTPGTGQIRTDADGNYLTNDSKSAAVFDVETDPVVRLRVAHADDAFTLSYAPRIVAANFGDGGAAQGGGVTPDVIHRPLLTLEKQFGPLDRFVLNGLVQFGTTTPGTLLTPERWNGEDRPNIPRAFPVLPFAQQTFLSIYAAAGLAHQFSPRFTGTLSAFYITFGQPTQAGRIAAGGTTYLQNPGVNLELEYKLKPTDTLVFNVAPQVNIVQASPVETDNDGNELADDGQPRFRAGPLDANGQPTQIALDPRYVNRRAPNTYQVLLEARYKKQIRRLTGIELAVGANVLQQSVAQAFVLDAKGQKVQVDNPFGLLGRTAETAAPSKNQFNLLPVGEVLLNQGFATGTAQGRLIAFSRADAWLNTISGEIGARSSTVAALNLDFGLDALRAQIAFIQSLPLSDRTTRFRQITTEIAYERELGKTWFVDFGARLGFQDAAFTNADNAFSTSFLQPGAFAAVSWRPLPAKL